MRRQFIPNNSIIDIATQPQFISRVRVRDLDPVSLIFLVLKLENGKLTYYDSLPRFLSRDMLDQGDSQVCEIVQLVCEWLRPTMADLFKLRVNVWFSLRFNFRYIACTLCILMCLIVIDPRASICNQNEHI